LRPRRADLQYGRLLQRALTWPSAHLEPESDKPPEMSHIAQKKVAEKTALIANLSQ
jgi:hypothetical protein